MFLYFTDTDKYSGKQTQTRSQTQHGHGQDKDSDTDTDMFLKEFIRLSKSEFKYLFEFELGMRKRFKA
jgi:hypothetical protein